MLSVVISLGGLLALSFMPLSAVAQAPDPGTKAVLDALQRIDGRLDGMQREIDQMKRGLSVAPAAQAPNSAPSAAQQQSPVDQPRRQLRPGWIVNVYNRDNGGNVRFDEDPIGTFVYAGIRFHSQIHEKSVPTGNHVGYEAKGFFRIRQAGRYVFFLKGISTQDCYSSLAIDDRDIFKYQRTDLRHGRSIQSGIDLMEGDFAITFRYVCDSTNPSDSEQTIEIRGPGDMVARELRPDEILHIARAERRSEAGSPPGAGQGGPLVPVNAGALVGAQRTVQRSVNVRRQPSTTAQMAAKLEPGVKILIRALTSDQEWAQVEANGQQLGFIKVTALVASSL